MSASNDVTYLMYVVQYIKDSHTMQNIVRETADREKKYKWESELFFQQILLEK